MQIEDARADPGFAAALEAQLTQSLRGLLPQSTNAPIALAVRGKDGALRAGLDGALSYGWLHVHLLWVAPEARRGGLGRALMQQAFQQAMAAGATQCWLETSNPEARAFYLSLGFAPFGHLANTPTDDPPSHQRWFLSRALSET